MVSSHNTRESGLRGLAWAALDRRFAQRYKAQVRTSDGAAAQAALIAGNCWLLTLEKSGTTYLCNALAFRNAIELGIEDQVDFDTIHLGGGLSWGDQPGANAGTAGGVLARQPGPASDDTYPRTGQGRVCACRDVDAQRV